MKRTHVLAVVVIAIVVIAGGSLLYIGMQPEEAILTSHHQNDVLPYPNFYRTNITIEAREGKEAYLRVQMAAAGLPGGLTFWLTHEVWEVSLSSFDKYFQPDNQTALDELTLIAEGRRSFSTIYRSVDYIWNDNPISPGNYVYLEYYEVFGDPGFVRADSVTSVVSVIYR
jgi:hypothetical protein